MNISSGRSEVFARHGMVASSQPLATSIGVDILKQGGTALDAAIACNAALALTEPHMCGPGGDLFAIIWDAHEGKLYGLNGNGAAPGSLSFDLMKSRLAGDGCSNIPADSILSVSVPGAVHGWFTLHEKFGRLEMKQLLAPVIRHAEEGFPITPVIAAEWQEFHELHRPGIPGDFHQLYGRNGHTPARGEIFSNQALASTYRLLARHGMEVFYEGEIAERITSFMAANGGYIDTRDMAGHTSEWIEPVSVNYRGYDVFELPPPGQGLAALQMLTVLEQEDIASRGFMDVDTLHLMLETKKLVYEDRARYYADRNFTDVPVEHLLDKSYAKQRHALIGGTAAREVRAGPEQLKNGDTVYLTTADSSGSMVSFIQSIYFPFGAGLVAPGTGFALQNRGMSFSMDPLHPNVYAPGKRPFHTIIPGFVMKDGKPFMSFGVMGGDMQPQGHVQVLTNMIDFNMTPQQAGDVPRWRHDGSTSPVDRAGDYLEDGGTVFLEPGFPEAVTGELCRRGHHLESGPQDFGGYQAIVRHDNGVYEGASERRKDGCAGGF